MVYSWIAIQNGDIKHFEAMYKETVEQLYSFNAKMTYDNHLAEDVTASAFEILWKEKQRFNISDGECLKVLYGISKKIIQNGTRKTKREIKFYSSLTLIVEEDFSEQVCNFDENQQKISVINSKIEKLSQKEKETYKMVFVEEKSYKEISTVLQVPIGTIKSRISKIKSKLR